EHHVGALGAALVVGRGRQLARLDEGTDHAAFEQDSQPRATQPLRQRGGQERDADAREYHLPVAELASAKNGEQLGSAVGVLKEYRCSPRRVPPRAIRRSRSRPEIRSTISVRGRSARCIAASL